MMCAALKVLQIVLELRPTSSFVAIFGQVQRFLEKWIFSDKPALIEAVAAVMVPIYRTIPIVEQGALQGSAATSEAKTFQSEAAHFRSVIDSGIFDRIQNGKQLSSALSHISAMARAASPSSGGSNTTSIDRFIPDLVKLVGVRLLPSIFSCSHSFFPLAPLQHPHLRNLRRITRPCAHSQALMHRVTRTPLVARPRRREDRRWRPRSCRNRLKILRSNFFRSCLAFCKAAWPSWAISASRS